MTVALPVDRKLTLEEFLKLPETEPASEYFEGEIYPDWIIEILSPNQSTNKVMKKILFCLKQGTQLGWLIDPEDESVLIFYPNQLPEIKSGADILPVLDVLSDWQFSAEQIFQWLTF
jgi:Uma2 family endonuclease